MNWYPPTVAGCSFLPGICCEVKLVVSLKHMTGAEK
jgi:hypothetical protein